MLKYRVWHIPQTGAAVFFQPVETPDAGLELINTLRSYDALLLQNSLRTDFTSASGIHVAEAGTDNWSCWSDGNGLTATELLEHS